MSTLISTRSFSTGGRNGLTKLKRDVIVETRSKRDERLLTPIHILIADDFEGWRRQVRLLLQARPEWQIVCDVSDGAEAVRKAEELKPELILLDISLPNLNGIDAARRILQLSPSSKILFLSTDNSQDLVQVAMSTGAQGYVHKARARKDLLSAVEAIFRDERFISGMFEGNEFTDASGAKAPQRHEVLFYSDDEVFLNSFTRFIATALEGGNVAIVIATESHRDSLAHRLKPRGLDINAARREGRFIPLDVAETLSTFMVNNMPGSNRFFEVGASLIKAAAKAGNKEHLRIAACGECAPTLWAEAKVDAAIRLEQLWDQLATTYDIDTLCGYSLSGFHSEKDKNAFQSICAEHAAVHFQ